MNRTLRRLYSLFAVVVFCIAAPLVVAWTSGYTWIGWRSGFTKVGAVYISSEPRAEVSLNGEVVGATPQRLNRLAPGSYTVALKKEGYGTWQHTIRVQGGVAQVLGPVYLYPQQFTVTATTLSGTFISTPTREAAALVSTQGTASLVTPTWPTVGPVTTLPWPPTAWSMTSTNGTTVFSHARQRAFITRESTTPWETTADSQVQWGAGTDTAGYAVDSGTLYRYDALTAQRTTLAVADSVAIVGSTAWITQPAAQQTTIALISTYGQTVPEKLLDLTGHWAFLPQSGAPLLRNTTTHEVVRLQRNALTGQVTTLSFGVVDTVWWPNSSQPPLWVNGNDLWTLGSDDQPQLLDRYSQPLQQAAWIVPGRILIYADAQGLHIESVSNDQGRGMITEWTTDHAQLLSWNLSSATALVRTENSTGPIVSVSWAK